jgi:hypothetical protein
MCGALPQRSPYTFVRGTARESMYFEVAAFDVICGTTNNLPIFRLITIVALTTVSMDYFVFCYCAKSNMYTVYLNKTLRRVNCFLVTLMRKG